MKSIFENVIARGSYDLTGLLNKIDTYHVEGRLTDAEREELCERARAHAREALSYDVRTEIDALWAAVRSLEARISAPGSGGTAATEPDPEANPEAAEFVQPTGAHDAYNTGDCVTYRGVIYRSLIDSNVWAPDVYPAGWEVIN